MAPGTPVGARISARYAEQLFTVLAAAELARNSQLRHAPAGDLIAMFDTGGCRHAGLTSARPEVRGLGGLARGCGAQVRGVECRLVPLELAHGRAMACYPGGPGLHGAAAVGS